VRNLSLVVCGAPLTARAKDVAAALEGAEWVVSVVPTAASRSWLDEDLSDGDFRRPDEPKPPRPDAVVVCPMTFNTANKWVHGHADNRPLSLLCESLGAGLTMVAVPFVNESLWRHPIWGGTLERLGQAGVRLVDPVNGADAPQPLRSGTGDEVALQFDPGWVVSALHR
jgi:hypothetical protein